MCRPCVGRDRNLFVRFGGVERRAPLVAAQFLGRDRCLAPCLHFRATPRILFDLAAQTHEPLVTWMDESGVLDLGQEAGFAVHYGHVMDAGRDSVDLLSRLLDRFGARLRYILVRKQIRGDGFGILERSGEQARAVDRQRVKTWLRDAYRQIDEAGV